MIKQLLTSATLFLMGTGFLHAHPGHDHAAAESALLHALFYSSMIAACAVAYYAASKMVTKSSKKITGEK